MAFGLGSRLRVSHSHCAFVLTVTCAVSARTRVLSVLDMVCFCAGRRKQMHTAKEGLVVGICAQCWGRVPEVRGDETDA